MNYRIIEDETGKFKELLTLINEGGKTEHGELSKEQKKSVFYSLQKLHDFEERLGKFQEESRSRLHSLGEELEELIRSMKDTLNEEK